MTDHDETGRGERSIVRVDAEFEDLLPGFLKDWKEEIGLMREALESNDYETVYKLGHDMHGIGGSCGLDIISDRGRGLAEGATAKDRAVIRKHLDALSDYLESAEFVYRS